MQADACFRVGTGQAADTLVVQRNNMFYPGWVYTIPTALLRLPFSAVEGIVWGIMVYILVGHDPEPGRHDLRSLAKACFMCQWQSLQFIRFCFQHKSLF